MTVDITKRKEFEALLNNLAETAEARWGTAETAAHDKTPHRLHPDIEW